MKKEKEKREEEENNEKNKSHAGQSGLNQRHASLSSDDSADAGGNGGDGDGDVHGNSASHVTESMNVEVNRRADAKDGAEGELSLRAHSCLTMDAFVLYQT